MAEKKTGQKLKGKYMGSVKVGPKGQVVIPKEARELYGIEPGDTLLILADEHQGIALQRLDYCESFFEEVFKLKDNG